MDSFSDSDVYYDLGVVEFGRISWMEEKRRLRKIMYGQMAAI